jgi:hypothetical protein
LLENFRKAHLKLLMSIIVKKINRRKDEFTKYEGASIKNCVAFIGTNVIDHAYARSIYKLSKHIGGSLPYNLKHML